MSIPTTTKVFRRSNGEYPRFLELSTEEIPPLQEADVLLRIHAVTLNYRDIAMLEEGKYPRGSIEKGIPASDCAAEVIAVGPAVANFEIGDRVSPLFDLESLTGTEVTGSALGGNVDGVLCEYRVINEQSLVRIPKHLSWEEVRHPLLFFFPLNITENKIGRLHPLCGCYSLDWIGNTLHSSWRFGIVTRLEEYLESTMRY